MHLHTGVPVDRWTGSQGRGARCGPGAPGSCPFSPGRSRLRALCLDCRPELTDVQGVLGGDSCPETPRQRQCRLAPRFIQTQAPRPPASRFLPSPRLRQGTAWQVLCPWSPFPSQTASSSEQGWVGGYSAPPPVGASTVWRVVGVTDLFPGWAPSLLAGSLTHLQTLFEVQGWGSKEPCAKLAASPRKLIVRGLLIVCEHMHS